MLATILSVLMFLSAGFLILLILIQRGRGGGLAGAFGGMGGQSAFGAKAGDVFTRVTVGVATLWIVLCVALLRIYSGTDTGLDKSLGAKAPVRSPQVVPGAPQPGAAADGAKAPSGGRATKAPGAAAPAEAAAPASPTPSGATE